MNLLFGRDAEVADWLSKQFGNPLKNWYFATGILNNEGILVGGASWHDLNGSNVEICFYGPHSVSPKVVRALMWFAFNQLRVNRVTARTPRQNKAVIVGLPKFGFRCEGVMKHYYGPVKRLDAIVFGLLKADAARFVEIDK